MTPTNTRVAPSWTTVAQREIMVRLTDRNFIIGFVMTVVLMAGAFGIQVLMADRPTTATIVTTSAEAKALAESATQAPASQGKKLELTLRNAASAEEARALVENKDADGYFHRSDQGWVYTTRGGGDPTMTPLLSDAVRSAVLAKNAKAAGTSVQALQQGSTLTVDALEENNNQRSSAAFILTLVTGFLLYLTGVLFGMGISSSVVEEKQSRIIEIIAAAIPLRWVLMGKVVGNTVIAVGQLLILVAIALLGISRTEFSSMLPMLTESAGWFIAFFAVSFVFIATAYATLGALASRTEDLQTTTMPITMVLVICFVITFQLRDEGIRQIASFIPVMSAFTMPSRVLSGEAAWWEPWASLAITLIAVVALLRLAEGIYRRSMMQTGGRLTLKQAMALRD